MGRKFSFQPRAVSGARKVKFFSQIIAEGDEVNITEGLEILDVQHTTLNRIVKEEGQADRVVQVPALWISYVIPSEE